jgi:hypothetical protein
MANAPPDSLWTLLIDVASARLLVWIASVGRNAELTPQAHRYFADRYRRLALCYETRGRFDRAKRLRREADEHWRRSGDDEPPYAAAMAMPRPARFLRTDAVSRTKLDGPDDDAA